MAVPKGDVWSQRGRWVLQADGGRSGDSGVTPRAPPAAGTPAAQVGAPRAAPKQKGIATLEPHECPIAALGQVPPSTGIGARLAPNGGGPLATNMALTSCWGEIKQAPRGTEIVRNGASHWRSRRGLRVEQLRVTRSGFHPGTTVPVTARPPRGRPTPESGFFVPCGPPASRFFNLQQCMEWFSHFALLTFMERVM